MGVADILGDVGKGIATGARVVGAVAKPLAEGIVNEEAGYAPQIATDKRKHAEQMEDAQIEVKAKELESQLALGQKYGTLNPQQHQQYVDAITNLYSHPRHAGTLMEKLRKAIHPNGAVAQGPQAPLPNAVPAGGTMAADEQGKLTSLQKTDEQKLQESQKEIDFWTAKLKAAGVPEDQVNAARNEAIERTMGATGSVLPKNAKLDIQGGVLVGGMDEHGRTFTNAQIQSGEAGPALKAMQDDFQKGEKDKADAAEKKEDKRQQDMEQRLAQTEGAASSRQLQSENFQQNMLGLREQEDAFKKADEQANNSQSLVDTYTQQYTQPGNHSATDTALVADYTTVLAKGGRKTQAELQMARNIGSFQLNMEQKVKKAMTGELPPQLRKMMLDYMAQAAQTQRQSADTIKPSLGGTGAKKVGQILKGGTGAAQVLPHSAKQQLKKGIVTTFKNGQKWTLGPDGQPQQVP